MSKEDDICFISTDLVEVTAKADGSTDAVINVALRGKSSEVMEEAEKEFDRLVSQSGYEIKGKYPNAKRSHGFNNWGASTWKPWLEKSKEVIGEQNAPLN